MQWWDVEKELGEIAWTEVKVKMLKGLGTARAEAGTALGTQRLLDHGDLRLQGRQVRVAPWVDT